MGWPRQSCAVLSRWLTTPPPPPPCPSFGLAILLFLRPFLSFSRVFREIPERPIISHNIIEARRARINRIRFPISRKKRYKRIFCRGRYSCWIRVVVVIKSIGPPMGIHHIIVSCVKIDLVTIRFCPKRSYSWLQELRLCN